MNKDMTRSSQDTPLKLSISPNTNFWWAIQSDNFTPVYQDGTLWAPLKGSRGQRVAHWDSLDGVQPGDLVLHYSRPDIRAISRVATAPEPAYTPRGYKEPADTEGTLVLTDPLYKVRIPWELVHSILPPGCGPMTAEGGLRRGYFFEVDRDTALKLLEQAGLEVSTGDLDRGRAGNGSLDQYLGGASDRWTIGAIRTEQRFLRDQQLHVRGSSCSLCGRTLPEELLIAAHIKPRSACSEKERMDTRNVSMLACLLGCDALYELGYVVVGARGIIEVGKPGPLQGGDRVQDIVGRKMHCPRRQITPVLCLAPTAPLRQARHVAVKGTLSAYSIFPLRPQLRLDDINPILLTACWAP